MSSVVDLYLLQLKSFLPAKQRDDVAAEIGESIASTVEERERELGRKLDEDETSDVLRTYGHPIVVAGRYLPKQYLIGPSVFPTYWYAVQAVLIVIAAVGAIVAGIALLTEPRAMQAALQLLRQFFWIALDATALVTLAFAVLEHRNVRLRFIEDFDPRKIGKGIFGVRSAPLETIPRRDTVLELAIVAIILLWWTGYLVFPSVMHGVKIELGSGVAPFYLPVIVLCLADLLRLSVELAQPYRTRVRVAIALCSNAAWLALFVLALSTQDLVQAAPSVEDPAEIARVALIAERAFRLALLALGAVTYMVGGPRNLVGMLRYDQRQEGSLRVGDAAPDVGLLSLDGKTPIKLSERIGGRPTVLVFGSFT